MKLDKELYTKHAKRLQVIINEKSTFVPYLAKGDFVKVIENSLNTLQACEKTLTNVEIAAKFTAKALAKEFNKLGKNTFKLDDKFKYDDESDLIDNINYLHTYCKNIFKVDLDDLVEGKEVKVSNPKIDLRAKTDVDEMPAAGMGMGMGMGMPGMDMGAMGGYQNPFVMGQAFAKVKQDIGEGKLYSYKSKPKAVIYAKIGSAITIALTIIALIVAAVFAFLSAEYQVKYTDGQAGLKFNATGPGIMYILIAAFGAFPLYQSIKGLTTKNDNLKYYFTWPWILIFVLMALLFVMPDMRVTWLLTADAGITQTEAAQSAFNAWKIMYIVSLGCCGLCLAPMILGAVCNPKQDEEMIQKAVQRYADEMIASYGFGPHPGQPTPPTDVQKPVEVKKPNTKKEEKDLKHKSDSKTKK